MTEERVLIRAMIRLLTAEEGGTQGLLGRQFRPSWNVGSQMPDGRMALDDAFVTLIGEDLILPGQEVEAFLEPILAEPWAHVESGMEIPKHAASRVIGRARILEVVRIAEPQ